MTTTNITDGVALNIAKARAEHICRQTATVGVVCEMIAKQTEMLQGLVTGLQGDAQEHYDALVVATDHSTVAANDPGTV